MGWWVSEQKDGWWVMIHHWWSGWIPLRMLWLLEWGSMKLNELKRQLQSCAFQPQFWLLLTRLLEIFWQTMCSCPGHSQNENIWRLFCPNKRAFEVKEAAKWTFYHFQKSRKMSLWHESSFELGSNVKILNFLEPVYLRMLQGKQIWARIKKRGICYSLCKESTLWHWKT